MSGFSLLKISIVIAVYNGATYLQRCIDSVTNQTYLNIELVIIDGGSSDGTIEIIKDNEDKISYWESEIDRGISHAWNKALKHITGDWVLFLGADDYLWIKDALRDVSGDLGRLSLGRCRIAYGKIAIVNESGQLVRYAGRQWPDIRKAMSKKNVLPHQGVFHRKDALISHGGFDESFRIAADYKLLLAEVLRNGACFLPNVVISGMQIGGLSTSIETRLTTIEEFIKAQNEIGLNRTPIELKWMRVKTFIKKILIASSF